MRRWRGVVEGKRMRRIDEVVFFLKKAAGFSFKQTSSCCLFFLSRFLVWVSMDSTGYITLLSFSKEGILFKLESRNSFFAKKSSPQMRNFF